MRSRLTAWTEVMNLFGPNVITVRHGYVSFLGWKICCTSSIRSAYNPLSNQCSPLVESSAQRHSCEQTMLDHDPDAGHDRLELGFFFLFFFSFSFSFSHVCVMDAMLMTEPV